MENEYVWGENGMYRISSSVAVQWLVCLSLSLEITEASFLKCPVRCLALNVSSIADLHENSPSLSLSLSRSHTYFTCWVTSQQSDTVGPAPALPGYQEKSFEMFSAYLKIFDLHILKYLWWR